MTSLSEVFELQAVGCRPTSPLYADLCDHVAHRLARGSSRESTALVQVLEHHGDDPLASMVALRFLGAVHRLVLNGLAPDLAAHYPSAGGSPGPGLLDAFEATVEAFADELAAGVREPVQTNEVGRAAALIGGFVTVAGRYGLPLRLLEVGASAGLLLRSDRFRYEVPGGESLGPPDSPVVLQGPWINPPPMGPEPAIVARRGCDRNPIDATTEEGRLRLRGFLWPDQNDRRARLDAALEVALELPVVVDRVDAGEWLAEQLAEPVEGVATVVYHSIVMQYLSRETRSTLEDALAGAGARATRVAPLARLAMEPGGEVAETRLQTWPGGGDEVIATSGYHGQDVEWKGRARNSNTRGTT